jgi:hypothetical protein
MKTRTLLLLSVGCGLLILLAGGFKLFQVATDRTEAEVLVIGTSATIGDMTVTVSSIEVTPDGLAVSVKMFGVAGEPVIEDWRLLGDGRVLEPSRTVATGVCDASSVVPPENAPVFCILRFPLVKTVQAVAYTRAGEQRQWGP